MRGKKSTSERSTSYSSDDDTFYFSVQAKLLSPETADLFSIEEMRTYGALALGFKIKRKLLKSVKIVNVGLVDPTNESALKAIEASLRKKTGPAFGGMKVFQIRTEHYEAAIQFLMEKKNL
jgi:hypothetical protein